jgi:hypothetical protein
LVAPPRAILRSRLTTARDSTLAAYHRARLEGYAITAALLEAAVDAGTPVTDAVRSQLAHEPIHIAPWHSTPLAVAACRDGMRLAALEFFFLRSNQ